MPLSINPTAAVTAAILSEIRDLQGAYEKGTRHLDAITDRLLSLDNQALADFGNFIGPVELDSVMTAHFTQGTGLNELATACEVILASAEGRDPASIRLVNVAPFSAKLAAQSRGIQFDGTTFTVAYLPIIEEESQPEPEIPVP